MIKKFIPYLVLCVCLVPLVVPLFVSGFFRTDDGGWMVTRLAAFHQALRGGQFPIRFLFALNHGYGYPVLDFLYPLPFYLGEMIHLLGFGFVDTVKILFGLSFILGAIFMYQYAGLSAALIYSYIPYRVFDVYSRGSLGEAVAFIFMPLIFYLVDKKRIILASLATAALICSHNTIALLFLPLVLIYSKNIKLILYSLLLSAWFWIPALYDLQFTRAGSVVVADFRQYFANYFDPIILVTLVVVFFGRKQKFWVLVVLASVFFALPVSTMIWSYLPLPRLVQFPWRFFAITVFSLGLFGRALPKYFVIAIVILGLTFLKVDHTFFSDSYYVTNDATTTVKNEYMPSGVLTDPVTRASQNQAVYFPGLKVVENGAELAPTTINNGIVTTSGYFVFRETPLRLVADLISVLALILAVLIPVFRRRF